MLVSKEEFIKEQQEKSKMVGKTYCFAHHATNKTFIGTVITQDEYSITVDGIGLPNNFKMYYGSYHVLEKIN